MTRKFKPPVPVYSALADSTRCRILEILRDGPVPVHRLAEAFSISRPAISRHLRVLKTAGLVAEVKKGRENLYAFRRERLGKAAEWIEMAMAAGGSNAEVASQPIIVPIRRPKVVAAAPPEQTATPVPKPRKPVEGINQMGFDF